MGGSCPPAWLGLVARRPGVRVRSGPSLMRVPPRALPGGRPPRPREKKRKGAGVRERDSPDRKAFSPWHVAPPSPSEPARRFSLSFAYLQSRPSCARRSLTGGLCYRKISVPCAFRSCLLWLGDRRCIQSDCLFVQSSCARGRPGHRRETHFALFLSLGSPLARPDADRPATTARRRIAKLQKIADGHATDSSARHRVAVGDLPTSNVSALRLVLQTLRFTPTPRLKIRTPRKRTSVPHPSIARRPSASPPPASAFVHAFTRVSSSHDRSRRSSSERRAIHRFSSRWFRMEWACHSSWSSMRSPSLKPIESSAREPLSSNVPPFHAPVSCMVALTGKQPSSDR